MRIFRIAGTAASVLIGVGCTDFTQNSEFLPGTDGFAFVNDGALVGPVLLDSKATQQLLGATVCEPGTQVDDACQLIPEAQYWAWARHLNAGMANGRSEGFAAFSQALARDEDDDEDVPETYGADDAASLDPTAALGSRLALWHAGQSTRGVVDATVELSGLETLRSLRTLLRQEGAVTRLGLVSLDEDGGPSAGSR